MTQLAMAKTEKNAVLEFFKSALSLIFIAIMLKGSIVEAFVIPSSSMKNTLLIGDRILVNKLSYGLRLLFVSKTLIQYDTPDRFDVVVFTRPDQIGTEVDESEPNIIKRVIGLPGETVEVRGTSVFINGEKLKGDDEHSRWVFGGTVDFGPMKVPAGKVFLLGDNRDESRDSRLWAGDHFLEISRIKGRAFVLYYPFDRMFKVIR
mgnify:CR=1 FL=1